MAVGAPVGNKNAAKAKLWAEAIKRALSNSAPDGTVTAGLDRLASKLVAAADAGDQWALIEIGNRLDGKPAQVIAGDEEAPLVFKEILIRAVDATRSRPSDEGE